MGGMMRSNPSRRATPPADPRIAELESQVNDLRAALHADGVQDRERRTTEV
jgi:hypothetical protein